MNIAWDGSAADFWAAVNNTRADRDIESDAAVLVEVLLLAQKQIKNGKKHKASGDASGEKR